MHAVPLHAALLGLLLLVPAGSQRTVSDADEDQVIRITDKRILVDGEEIVSLGDDDDEPMVIGVGGRRGYLGVRLVGITDDLRKHYGAPEDAGILVAGLEDDSPAAKAGVQVGDVITQIDGDRVDSSGDLSRALRDKKAGDKVRLHVIRDRRAQDLTLTVEERPPDEAGTSGDCAALHAPGHITAGTSRTGALYCSTTWTTSRSSVIG